MFRLFRPAVIAVVLHAAGAASAQAPDPLQQHYQAARTYQVAGNLQKAENEYRAALPLALRRMAAIASAKGDAGRAIALLGEALEFSPGDPQLRIELGLARLRQDDAQGAGRDAEAALALDPGNPAALHLLGKSLFAQGRSQEAVAELEKAVLKKASFQAGYDLALAYLKIRDVTRCTLLFDEMVLGMGDSASLRVMFGRAFRAAGFYEQAIASFTKAVALDPKFPIANFWLGLANLQRDDQAAFAAAKAAFEAELRNSPEHFATRYLLGYIHVKERSFGEAEEHLKVAVRVSPNSPDPAVYLGQVYLETGRLADAERTLRQALTLAGSGAGTEYETNRAHYMLGRALVALGRKEEGEREIKTSQEKSKGTLADSRSSLAGVIADQPQENAPVAAPMLAEQPLADEQVERIGATMPKLLSDAYNNLGVIAAQQQDLEKAYVMFSRASQWAPETQSLQRNLGLAAFSTGHYDAAAGALERHLQKSPTDARSRGRLATSYYLIDRFADVARVLAEPVSRQEPALAYIYGSSLLQLGRTEEATQVLSGLEAQHADAPEVHFLVAQALAQKEKYRDALARYDRVLSLDPGFPLARYYRGLVLLRQSDPVAAERDFREQLKTMPSHPQSLYHLAYVLLQQHQNAEATSLLRRVIALRPEYAEAPYQLGKTLLESGEVEEAMQHLEEAVRLAPEKEYMRYQLSLAYRKAARAADAERELREYQRLKAQARRGGMQGE